MDIENLLIATSVIARIIGFLFLLPVLIKQYKETNTKDGILFVRWGIFLCTILYVTLSVLFLTFNGGRILGFFGSEIVNVFSLSAGVANMIISIVLYMIYFRKYE